MRSNHPKFYHRIVWCVLRLQVSENYDKQLVPPEERHLGRELRSQMVAAEEALLEVCDAIAHTHSRLPHWQSAWRAGHLSRQLEQSPDSAAAEHERAHPLRGPAQHYPGMRVVDRDCERQCA